MNEEQKAYIAGIIDGEGSIMLVKLHKNQFPSPCVSISSSTIELLEWIKTTVNHGVIKRKKNYDIQNHKDSFTYELRQNYALELLKEIQPYLVIKSKKLRANLITNEYKLVTSPNGRYSKEMLNAKKEFYERFISIK